MLMRRLWWKEFRQMMPLMTILVVVALSLMILFSIDAAAGGSSKLSVLMGLPALFSVGAGALIVGQEKETRTLGWLQSLPVRAADLVRIKLLVCLLGWLCLWLISGLLALAFMNATQLAGLDSGHLWSRPGEALTWPLHSLYLPVAGIALAWRLKSSLVGLLLLIPVALLPFLAAWTISWLIWATAITDRESSFLVQDIVLAVCQSIGIVIALVCGWSLGLSALQPAAARPGSKRSGYVEQPWVRRSHPLRPWSALLWQVARQNGLVIGGCSLALFVCVVADAVSVIALGENPWPGFIPIYFLAVSWLGVSVFQGDRLQNRIQFMAVRGISPRKVWLSRQWLPMSIVLIGTVLLGALKISAAEGGPSSLRSWSLAMVALAVVVYSISQWIGQVTSSPIVAAIAGPALSLFAASYLSFSAAMLGAPLSLLAVCSLLPVLFTVLQMRQWMDGQLGLRFWSKNALGLTGFLLLPALPFLLVVLTYPGLDAATRREFEAELARSGPAAAIPSAELVLTVPSASADQDSAGNLGPENSVDPNASTILADPASSADPSEIAELAEASEVQSEEQRVDAMIGELERQLEKTPPTIRLGFGVERFLYSELALTRMSTESLAAGTEVAESEPDHRQPDKLRSRMNRLVKLTCEIISKLRQSPRLIEQDTADRLEIYLLAQLLYDREVQYVPAESRRLAATILGGRDARNAARRRAVAASGLTNEASSGAYLGGYDLPAFQPTNVLERIKANRAVGRCYSLLWRYAQSVDADTQALRLELATMCQVPPAIYGLGPGGQYHRADDLGDLHSVAPIFLVRAPGTQWHADWEDQAEQLAAEITETAGSREEFDPNEGLFPDSTDPGE